MTPKPLLGLVLSGGGARAAYQVGVLAQIAERIPEIRFPILTGVSSGAINAAFLAGHRGPWTEGTRMLREAWSGLTVDRVFHSDVVSLTYSAARWVLALGSAGTPVVSSVRGLVNTEPLRAYLTKTMEIEGIDERLATGELRALALSVTSYSTGVTVTFVHGQRGIPTWERAMRRGVNARITIDHLMASCSIPLLFPAIRIGNDFYGDGALRPSARPSPAVHLGADRVLAIAVERSPGPEPAAETEVPGYPPPARVIALMFHSLFLDRLDADAERLERINELIDSLPPGARTPERLRKIELLLVRPSRSVGRMAAQLGKSLPRPVRLLLRGLGAHRTENAGLASYLMFGQPFANQLMDLGYEDAARQWPALARFLQA